MAGQLRVDEITDEAGTGSPDFINGIQVGGTQFTSSTLGGNYIQQTFTSPGTWTKPVGLKAIRVRLAAGGGGGGATVAQPPTPDYGAGTGVGGAARGDLIPVYINAADIPGPVTVVIGSGGAGGAAGPNPGQAGGTSSFGTLISATGGGGGGHSGTSPSPVFFLSGTAGTVGGLVEGPAVTLTYFPAGASYGTRPAPVSGFGQQAIGVSTGGGNSQNSSTVGWAAKPGGAGAPGIVIVEEFY
jgi:hypothetical protein